METRKAKVFFDDRISTLNRDAAGVSPAKEVFTTASAILALVRDKMIDNKDIIQLSEYCFNVCEALNTVTQEQNAEDIHESVRMALEDSKRVMCEIERTLEKGANTPHIKYNKEKVEGHMLEIQRILGVLNPLSPHLDEKPGADGRSPRLTPVDLHRTVAISVFESACGRLVRHEFAPDEFPSLIEVIFSSDDKSDAIRYLPGNDAQTFVDVIDEALDKLDLSLATQKKCLKLLYRTCSRHAFLPKTLNIPVCYDQASAALYRGGYADVWKGEYGGRDVAVKVIRTYSNSDLQKIIGRFCREALTWKFLRHPNVLPLIGVTMSEARFAMISDWMADGNINDFVKAHPNADRPSLLAGVAKGLTYIHTKGMIHGDLKGANILIDQTGHARLADFGLLTIISDPTNLLFSSSYTGGGTVRWMSPELIYPQGFGFKSSHPTESSDCYALGMVIYEIISGNLPFHEHANQTVLLKVLKGECPPRGARFTQSLWKMLERCWAFQPNNRPSIEDVLRCLETVSRLPESPSLRDPDEEMVARITTAISSGSSYLTTLLSPVLFGDVEAMGGLDHGVRCDSCSQTIIGTRYQCGNCPSIPHPYNLCQLCDNKSYMVHDPTHMFFKFPRQVDRPIESTEPVLPILYKYRVASAGILDSHDPKAYLRNVMHTNIFCDLCMEPIQGQWFHCVYCPKDLCDHCEETDEHDTTHFSMVAKAPVDMSKFYRFVGMSAEDDFPPPIMTYPVYNQ